MGLEEFTERMTSFFLSANDQLDADAVHSGLATHTDHLLEQVDAHGAGDFVAAFAIGRDAHEHMGAVSNLLATGIVHQFPERFLPDTALRPASGPSALGWLAVGAAVVIVARTAWTAAHRARATPPAAGSRSFPSRSAGRARGR